MGEMSMNKAIHGAIRRDLERLVRTLDAFPAGDLVRARQVNAVWKNFDDQLTRHHEGEHRIAWPALETVGVSRAVLAEMDAEHDVMAANLLAARTAVRALLKNPGVTEARAAAAAVRSLRKVTLAHLDHEDREIEQIYLDHRHDDAIKAMGREFGKVSPAAGGRFFAWVLDGATDDERAAIARDVPAPVLTIIGGVFGAGYRRNVAALWNS